VFTDPEVARVGIAEGAASGRARVAEVAMSQVDRAVTEDRTEGFVRLVAAPRPILGRRWGGRLVGATIVCPRAGELIHEPALAIRSGMFAGRLAQTVHAYPTWSTAIRQAAARLVPRGREPGGRPPRE
jgi:pyruvate/2-oxoglutarate dehydrogenase complex dihydrolipoamide dehydrogenase (E3) component